VRKAAPYDHAEGAIVGFAAEQWQVEQPKPRRERPRSDGANGVPAGAPPGPSAQRNGATAGHRPAPPSATNGATTEASRPGVESPVSGETARLIVTVYETENVAADEALLKAVVGILKDNPGNDEVRLVVHDGEGNDIEFDLPRAAASEDLARTLRAILRQNGNVRLTGQRIPVG
jgi:hypothetical protein